MTQLFVHIISYILAMTVSAAAAGFLTWTRLRQQSQTTVAAIELERALLSQSVQQRDDQIDALKVRLATEEQERSNSRIELKNETELRLTLERQLGRIPDLEASLAARVGEVTDLQKKLVTEIAKQSELQAQLDQERKSVEEKLKLLDEAQHRLSAAFKAMCADALQNNNQSFLELAKVTLDKAQESAKGDLEKRHQAIAELVKPVKDSLEKFDSKVQEIEKVRVGAYESITQQVKSLIDVQHHLRSETSNLVRALRSPIVRGRWGEIQLKRVVEMAGMVDHCDFFEQESVATDDGRLRPDLIVRLPGEKSVVVDAKAPLDAYLAAIESQDDTTRKAKFAEHAQQVRNHIVALSRKSYWDQFEATPEFVVLFLPGENFFSAALEEDPSLIEFGVEQRVILSTPTTLIALLRAVAYGWKQERIAADARQISDLGRELYKRIADMGGHWTKLGKHLGSVIEAYNHAVGSLETRVLVSARKFKQFEATPGGVEIDELSPVEKMPRLLQAPEIGCATEAEIPQSV